MSTHLAFADYAAAVLIGVLLAAGFFFGWSA
jgi:hypothetical protein